MSLLCHPDEIARLAGDLEPTQARVLLFAFEEAGLVRRGPDCTLEATLLLNRTPDEILATLTDPPSSPLAAGAVHFTRCGCRAASDLPRGRRLRRGPAWIPARSTRCSTRLAGQELLIYRPYAAASP